jgi:hypothetical protein
LKIEVDLTDQELAALELLARGRQIRILAEAIPAQPADRAIAKVLLAGNVMRNPEEQS